MKEYKNPNGPHKCRKCGNNSAYKDWSDAIDGWDGKCKNCGRISQYDVIIESESKK